MSQSLSRAELDAMTKDELKDLVLELATTVNDQQTQIQVLESRCDALLNETERLAEEIEDVRDEQQAGVDTLHRERSKLARRVSALEDEIGVTTTDALATAEGGSDAHTLTKLGRLIRHGPEAVSDRPTEKMRRARDIVDNWSRWGTVRDDALGTERRLASKKHDLKTRLEDTRNEDLSWLQVYRAMELIDDWSDSNVTLEEGSDEEGKYVLVHEKRGDES